MTKPVRAAGVARPIKLLGPYKLDAHREALICKALDLGSSLRGAAAHAGISPGTITDWLSRGRTGEEPYASFAARCDLARAAWEVRSLEQIEAAAAGGAWQAAAWRLERRIDRLYARKAPDLSQLIEKLVNERLAAELQAAEDRAHGLAATAPTPAAPADPDANEVLE